MSLKTCFLFSLALAAMAVAPESTSAQERVRAVRAGHRVPPARHSAARQGHHHAGSHGFATARDPLVRSARENQRRIPATERGRYPITRSIAAEISRRGWLHQLGPWLGGRTFASANELAAHLTTWPLNYIQGLLPDIDYHLRSRTGGANLPPIRSVVLEDAAYSRRGIANHIVSLTERAEKMQTLGRMLGLPADADARQIRDALQEKPVAEQRGVYRNLARRTFSFRPNALSENALRQP